MTYKKKLIEVALQLEAINIASAREKSIRHGTPSTLRLWWAWRPLAAARLGLESHASDLNPVAVLINKAMIEIPPKFAGQPPVNPRSRSEQGHSGSWRGAQGLAEDVRLYGQWMRDEAFKRIGQLYPQIEITAEMLAADAGEIRAAGQQDLNHGGPDEASQGAAHDASKLIAASADGTGAASQKRHQ